MQHQDNIKDATETSLHCNEDVLNTGFIDTPTKYTTPKSTPVASPPHAPIKYIPVTQKELEWIQNCQWTRIDDSVKLLMSRMHAAEQRLAKHEECLLDEDHPSGSEYEDSEESAIEEDLDGFISYSDDESPPLKKTKK